MKRIPEDIGTKKGSNPIISSHKDGAVNANVDASLGVDTVNPALGDILTTS